MKLWLVGLVVLAGCGSVSDATIDGGTGNPDADPCEGATCECTVATEDADCGAHEFCNATTTGRTCECAAGYTAGVNGCVWTGALADPGFADPAAWESIGGALVDGAAAGGVDPGAALFNASNLCNLALVKQTAVMPTFAKAQPLVLLLSYKNQTLMGERVTTGISFGGANWSALPAFADGNFHEARICVPAGGFAPALTVGAGAPVTFAFGPYTDSPSCPNSALNTFAFDHAELVPANANECGTTLGQGPNYDAEGIGGWTFTATGSSSGSFVAGIGAGGTKAARVNLALRCESARMETAFDVPDVANPVLEMFVGASAGNNPTLSFGPQIVSLQLQTPGAGQTIRMCLPPGLRGQRMTLGVSVNGGTGSCADTVNQQVFADNVKVVDDPTCASSAAIANPGLEHAGSVFGSTGSFATSTGTAIVRDTAGGAHGGTKFLALESQGRCAQAQYTVLPIVPPANGAAGPALKFFAKVGTNANATTSVSTRGAASQTLTEGGGYLPYTICLSPKYIGRMAPVRISHDGGSGLCDNSNYVAQGTAVDDFEVTTDPACPAQ